MILNIYKPLEWTSFDVVAKVRSILRGQTGKKKIKVGHAGTLDPLAEGVLIILTGHDTKKQDLIMKKPKEYLAEIAFGAVSETYDLEGTLSYSEEIPSLETLRTLVEAQVESFLGIIEQRVPPYSAAKVAGKRLYVKARAGELEQSEIPTKKVVVHSFEIIDVYESEVVGKVLPTVKVAIVCGSGTYVRSIAHDLGEIVGCGAVLKSLIRTRVGEFNVENSLQIEEIEKKLSLRTAYL